MNKPIIFVVDDDNAVRKSLALSLQERGFRVESFASGKAFLDAFEIGRHGCVLLDAMMPQTSGLELQDELRRRDSMIPIIFLTAHGDIPMSVQAMRSGAFDFLEKPCEINLLLERVAEALAEDEKNHEAMAEDHAIRKRFRRITPREREVMKLIVAGAANTSNRDVADRLGISHRTVDTYRARLMEKMQARSLPDLVQMAKICGIYEP